VSASAIASIRAVAQSRRSGVTALRGLAGIALLALAVQALAMWGPRRWQVPDLITLTQQVGRFVSGDAEFTAALAHSLRAIVLALTASLVVGVTVGVVVGLSATAYRAVILPLELVRPVPAVAVIPVMILALGQGLPMEIAVIVVGAWWPILFNTLYGVRNIDVVTIETGRVFGLSRRRIVGRVVVPSILPMVITGLRIAAPLALILAVGAEYLATAGKGLGGILIRATSTGDLTVLWAAAVVTGTMGLLLGALTWSVGRLLCPWSADL